MTTPARLRGVSELVASAVLFGLMAYLAKKATRALDGSQVALVRFLVGVAAVAARALCVEPLRPRRFRFLLLRGFFGGIAVLLYFLSIGALPVGTASLLNYTAPVFTAAFAWLFLRERLPPSTFGALACAAAGVTLVVLGQGRALGGAYGWQLVALASAVASGAAITSLRAARRTDGPWEVFGAFCVVGVACTAPLALARWRSPGAADWALLLAVGLVSVWAQILLTRALGAVEAAVSGASAQLAPVVALALGHFLDSEPLSATSLFGAVLTLGGVSWAAWAISRAGPPSPHEARRQLKNLR